jgi:MSHA type pilus biogenesis protein MshL
MKHNLLLSSIATLTLLLFSCNSNTKNFKNKALIHDKEVSLSKSDFKKSLIDSEFRSSKAETKKNNIPELPKIFQYPAIPDFAEGKLVSIKVTEDVPLKDVLIELARLAEIEVEIDPSISGGVIIIAKDRPLIDIIQQISSLADLRYSISNGILRIERDLPYFNNYALGFLDIERNFTSSLTISTTTSSEELSSGGESSLNSTSESSIWDSIQKDIEKILQIESEISDNSSYVTINKKAGIISISATEAQHKHIEHYLSQVTRNITAQVLIEAKIIEVSLDEKFETGINWTELSDGNSGNFSNITDASNIFSLGITRGSSSGKLDGTMQFIQSFGTTRTLSSPRITALNNQQSVLSFTENKVYFEVDVDNTSTTTDSGITTDVTVETELKTVPIGIILSLLPSINLDKNEVTMNIRPTISSSSSSVNDPAVDIASAEANANITSSIPEVQLKEIDTMLKLKSGETMVIGGLIEHSNSDNSVGVPWLKDIPLLGYFFKSSNKDTNLTETVIFIKATIIGSETQINQSDRDFYNIFTRDPQNLGI